jgi:hypothetical protein
MKEYCTRYVTSQFTLFFIPYFLPDNYAYVLKAFPDEPKLDMLLINIPVKERFTDCSTNQQVSAF